MDIAYDDYVGTGGKNPKNLRNMGVVAFLSTTPRFVYQYGH
jgi:hypothetical protein